MSARTEQEAIQILQQKARPLQMVQQLDPLMDRIGDARVVMLGEASHGTHEFYTWRNAITRRLIKEKGFNFLAVEADWPDCYRINRFIKHYEQDEQPLNVLTQFHRWPTWMWANWEIASLASWLRKHNHSLQLHERVGFYGLDVYSLWDSLHEVRQYLTRIDPSLLPEADRAFRCFEPYTGDEGQSYARATQMVPTTCEQEVLQMLMNIQSRMPAYDHDVESAFSTEQNALIAVNAEKYYRSMLHGGA